MVDPLVVNRKLQKMGEYLKELETMRKLTFNEYMSDFRHRRTVERLIQLIVDAAVDINTHAVVDSGSPTPKDSYSSFFDAAKTGMFTRAFAKKIAPSTGERNVIVHEYDDIDDFIVYESIEDALEMYSQYVKIVSKYNAPHS